MRIFRSVRLCSVLCQLGYALLVGAFYSYAHAETLQISATENPRVSDLAAHKVLTLAYQQLGIQVNFVKMPIRRAYTLAESGQLDGLSFYAADGERENLIKISVPVSYNDVAVFTVNKEFTVSGYESLRPYSIGMVAGIKYFEDNLRGMRVDPAPTIESLFQKLASGRTDIAVDTRTSQCVVKKLGLATIHMLEPNLTRRYGYHIITKKHEDLVPRLETILRKMQSDGTIDRLQKEAESEFISQC